MCGRYVLSRCSDISDRFGTLNKLELEPNYNVAPSFNMPVIIKNSPNKIVLMRWGLIPHWAKDPRIGYKMINARKETVATAPSFRVPVRKQRCLVAATGFYEWKKTGEEKVPYYIHMKDDSMFAFAGIYDIWKDAEGKEIKSFTIITCPPNTLMENIHNRMPVILKKSDENKWLDTGTPLDIILEMLNHYNTDEMEAYTVSTDVNNPRNQGDDLINKK